MPWWIRMSSRQPILCSWWVNITFMCLIPRSWHASPLLPSQITSVFNVVVSLVLQEYIGPLGIVVANCFAMSIRIAYTLCYIRFNRFSWTSEAFLPAIMPRKQLLLLMCGTCALSIVTSKIHTAINVFGGALTLLITFMALVKLERSSLMTIRQSKKEVWCFWILRVVPVYFEVESSAELID